MTPRAGSPASVRQKRNEREETGNGNRTSTAHRGGHARPGRHRHGLGRGCVLGHVGHAHNLQPFEGAGGGATLSMVFEDVIGRGTSEAATDAGYEHRRPMDLNHAATAGYGPFLPLLWRESARLASRAGTDRRFHVAC